MWSTLILLTGIGMGLGLLSFVLSKICEANSGVLARGSSIMVGRGMSNWSAGSVSSTGGLSIPPTTGSPTAGATSSGLGAERLEILMSRTELVVTKKESMSSTTSIKPNFSSTLSYGPQVFKSSGCGAGTKRYGGKQDICCPSVAQETRNAEASD